MSNNGKYCYDYTNKKLLVYFCAKTKLLLVWKSFRQQFTLICLVNDRKKYCFIAQVVSYVSERGGKKMKVWLELEVESDNRICDVGFSLLFERNWVTA